NFRFEGVPFGDWKLQVEAPGFQSNPVLISRDAAQPDGHILLSLLPATHIKGRALDERGRPVADLKITAIPVLKDRALMVEPHLGSTDSEGRFDIIGVRQGIYRVHAGPPRSPIGEEREVQLAGREAWLELVVPVFGRASVTVTDQKTGKGLEGIRVVVQGSRFFDSGRTDAKGRALFPTLLPGEFAFTAYGSTHHRRTVQRAIVQAEQLSQVEIRMVPLHSDR
ncbi:MAG: carboxypeptidase regulatory-like domain-containing protein, partial [Planctomycetota bacterium]